MKKENSNVYKKTYINKANADSTKQDEKMPVKKQILWAVGMTAAALLLFMGAPAFVNIMPENLIDSYLLFLYSGVFVVFFALVGWKSNDFTKLGYLMPAVALLIYVVSEICYYGMLSVKLEIDYLQAGYMAYFIVKLYRRNKKLAEKKTQKPAFPKSVKK